MKIIILWLLIFQPIVFLYGQKPLLIGVGKSIKGYKEYQQDYFYLSPTNNNPVIAILCDGHGEKGNFVAKTVTHDLKDALNNTSFTQNIDQNKKLIQTIFAQINVKLKKKFAKDAYKSGTTCIALLLIDNKFYLAHVGDSRAVWGLQLDEQTQDHTGHNYTELTRVGKHNIQGPQKRLNGTLMVTRAFGDFYLEKFNLVATPEINVLHNATTPFIILGCDGLWDGTSKKNSLQSTQTDNNRLIYELMYKTIVEQNESLEIACKRILTAAICSTLANKAQALLNLFLVSPRTQNAGLIIRQISPVSLDDAIEKIDPLKKDLILALPLNTLNTFIKKNQQLAHDNTTIICIYNKNAHINHLKFNNTRKKKNFWERLNQWWVS